MDNGVSNPIEPKPKRHSDINPYNDLTQPLDQKEEQFLKENGCSIAQFELNNSFMIKLDMNVPLSSTKIFAKIISKQIKYQLDEFMNKIYGSTLEIQKPSL